MPTPAEIATQAKAKVDVVLSEAETQIVAAEQPVVKEPPKEEPPKEEKPSPMGVGIDAGGWNWSAAVADFAGCVKRVRSSYANYNSPTQAALLQAHGMKLYPLFSGGGSIGGISHSAYVAEIINWFKAFGTGTQADTCEVLNEPGNPYFWSDSGNVAGYVSLVKAVKQGLISAGLGNVKVLISWDGGFGGDAYGRSLLAAGLQASDYDGVTVHPYGGHGSDSAQGNRARVTEAIAEQPHPVYVTEVGWPTAVGQPPTGDSLQWSQQQQAENIKNFVEWCRGLQRVALVINFNYADYSPNNYYGIVDTTGKVHKASYAALKALAS